VTDDKRYQYYLPLGQYQPQRGQRLLLKLRGDPALQGEEVRKALQPLMPGDGYVVVRPMREALDQAYRSWELGATMFVAFGVLALVVAAIGLYGVVGYDVAQRTHELAVRIALGARPGDIVRAVMGWGVRFAIAGIGLGSLAAFGLSGWLEPLLFKQSARDPLVYAVVAAVLLLAAVLASLYPATRASQADPNSVLKAA
jgi:ABC-type antimicrobial peptide transport system permease subunit